MFWVLKVALQLASWLLAAHKPVAVKVLLFMCTQERKKERRKIQLKLQLQQIITLRIFSSILAFTEKTIFSFLSFKTEL